MQKILLLGLSFVAIHVSAQDTLKTQSLDSAAGKSLEGVTIVASTRTGDRIENATTKVEVLGQEEMNEESTLKPGNIASILGDMSGIQIQQSSVTSGNSNVRIQGLDGKYTQILRDGMPLYEGYSGGFGILTIAPLDLQQIELIKGAASTLYGGGAIGGLINLISKKPGFNPDASFLINRTTLKETNFNAYYSRRNKWIGLTFFAGQNLQSPIDVNKDGLSDLPDSRATIIHPTLFFYPSSNSTISLGWSGSFDKRKGGDMLALDGKQDPAHPYFEKNTTARNTFNLLAENRFSPKLMVTLKASTSLFKRDQTTNTYAFSGRQTSYYTEASLNYRGRLHSAVSGINFTGDQFKPVGVAPLPVGSFSNQTSGLFAQDTWTLPANTKLEAGLRWDHHLDYGNFILPRLAVFHRFNETWGTRLGFGMGYKTPNPLTPQIKDYDMYSIHGLPIDIKPERSYGANIEVNYKRQLDEESSIFINHAFFITSIKDPVVGYEPAPGELAFYNGAKPIVTRGFDTYVQMKLDEWEIYLGYTYTEAERKYLPANNFMLLTPRNRAASVVSYEIEGKWRFGVEASYTGYQYREDYSRTPSYVIMALMTEKDFGPKCSLVLNCENLLDERQSKYEPLYTGPVSDPRFKALWAPIDGRAVNLALRWKPFAR